MTPEQWISTDLHLNLKIQTRLHQGLPWCKRRDGSIFPDPFGSILQQIFLVDSDRTHDLVIRKSLSGILGYVVSTSSTWMSKRYGSIAWSTYAPEFSALRTATKESQSIRYMMRYLVYNVPSYGSCPTRIFDDNLSVILNAQNPAADLSKKYVAISFSYCAWRCRGWTIEPYWLKDTFNKSDITTKQIPRPDFKEHVDYIYWRPNSHIQGHNILDDAYMDTNQ